MTISHKYLGIIDADNLLAIGIGIIPILLFLRQGWIEPDSFAFFNYYCLDGKAFDVPFLSNIFFGILPCNIFSWYAVQASIWILSLATIVHVNKHFFKIPFWENAIIGLCLSFLYSTLAFEDDFLAFPFIYASYWFALLGKGHQQYVGLAILFLTTFIWKGAALIALTAMFSLASPLIGLIVPIGYIFHNGVDSWGGSTEAVIGLGFVTLLPLLFSLFYSSKEAIRDWRGSSLFFFGLPFLLLTVFQVKWGLWLVLFYPVYFHSLIKNSELRASLAKLAGIVFIIGIITLSTWKEPQPEHWSIIEEGVSLQNQGKKVFTYWSVGRWFEYKGGKASQAGGYKGPQDSNQAYWIGPEKTECNTIKQEKGLFLQYCP